MNEHQRGRRRVLAGATVATAAVALGVRPSAAQPAAPGGAVRWSTGTAPARTPAPPNATDCHFHIYDQRFPPIPNAALLPPDASPDDYRALQRRTGTTRGVLVQPSTYGTDNRLHLQSMAALGRENFRMVAVVNDQVTDDELARLHEAGVRGIRFNLSPPGTTTPAMLEPLAPRVARMGWHFQVHMLGDQLVTIGDTLMRLPVRICVDHRGRVPQPAGVNHPAFALVKALLEKGNGWVKLSGLYMDTKDGAPGYADSVAVARALHAANPARCVWGSDWPHPTQALDNKPDDAQLFDLLAECVPDEAARRRVLVDNPAELYDFPKG